MEEKEVQQPTAKIYQPGEEFVQEEQTQAPVEEPKQEVVEEPSQDALEEVKESFNEQPREEAKEEVQAETPVEESGMTRDEAPVIGEDAPVIGENTPVIEETQPEVETKNTNLPEWIDNLVKFHEETGGGFDDYAKINRNVEALTDDQILAEFYKTTKPHLSDEDIALVLDNKFSTQDLDEEDKEFRLKNIEKKEEVALGRKFLEDQKEKYLVDIPKVGTNTEADKFYQDYKQQEEQNKIANQKFQEQTDSVFRKDMKGFSFEAGEGVNYTLNFGDIASVRNDQADLGVFIQSYLDENGTLKDPAGYHKSLWAAKNADKIAKSFYEQGRADAITESAKRTKNIDMDVQTQTKNTTASSPRAKVIFDPYGNN